MLDIVRDKARHIVHRAGARWDGTLEVNELCLVLFTSPRTGSTLAMQVDELLDGDVAHVKAHIAASDAKFGHKRV